MPKQKITPFLWFDTQAEEAANLYVSVFKDATLLSVARYSDAGPGPKGSAMTVHFTLFGQEFIALNGGPHDTFNESVSFLVHCDTQEEVDHYWDRLIADGGAPSQCGWLKDKYGVSWQIVPRVLLELQRGEPARVGRMMQAMMGMRKLDVAGLRRAYEGAG
jgi:predicted 3-demethylubiquinone-9 3-methyltransferase (glyoxalase superfamily)